MRDYSIEPFGIPSPEDPELSLMILLGYPEDLINNIWALGYQDSLADLSIRHLDDDHYWYRLKMALKAPETKRETAIRNVLKTRTETKRVELIVKCLKLSPAWRGE